MPEPIPIGMILRNEGTQSRLGIDEETVFRYREILQDAEGEWPFPPLDVFRNGDADHVLLACGFHRIEAAEAEEWEFVPCEVHAGDAIAARLYGMVDNDTHGLRMTRADKRHNLEWLLDHFPDWSITETAEKGNVSLSTVKRAKAERRARTEITPPDLLKLHRPDPIQEVDDATATVQEPPPVRRFVCPRCGGYEADADGDCVHCCQPQLSPLDIARQQIRLMRETIGRFLSRNPSVDKLLEILPSAHGHCALTETKMLFESLKKWENATITETDNGS